jgi:ATP-dependent DNA ligase
MTLTRIAAPFDHADFVFELKHDGFRCIAYISDGRCDLVSRRKYSYKSFDSLKTALAKLKATDAILDGEICCLDSHEHGMALYREICERDLEGIVAKRRDSVYSPAGQWLKILNPNYTQHNGRQEKFTAFKERSRRATV